MEEEKVEWLRTVYREVPPDPECPCPKKVKLSDLHQQLQEKYLPEKITHNAVSQIVRKAFPQAESKIAGKSRTKHLFGIEPAIQGGSSTTQARDAPIAALLESERAKNKQLTERLVLMEARIQELERTSPATLAQQADQLLQHSSLIACGPDTPDHFRDFSVDGVIRELRDQVPDTYELFMQLGNIHRNVRSDDSTSTEEVKAVTSLCVLLNARSARMKGIQLLISMMLIARSTSKQVSK